MPGNHSAGGASAITATQIDTHASSRQLGSVTWGHLTRGFHLSAWLPGPVAHALDMVVFHRTGGRPR